MTLAVKSRPLTAADIGASPQVQPPLPFADTGLEPVISARTIGLHYGKHHKGYFDTLAKLVAGTPWAASTLEDIIFATADDAGSKSIFNNAAQCWNHNFYWQSLSAQPQTPASALATAIDRDFGSLSALQAELVKTTVAQFGSGWGWLVADGEQLRVISTGDADVPFTRGLRLLLTIDVWEHAYYLDWQNRRPDHVEALVKGHLNWDFAARNFA